MCVGILIDSRVVTGNLGLKKRESITHHWNRMGQETALKNEQKMKIITEGSEKCVRGNVDSFSWTVDPFSRTKTLVHQSLKSVRPSFFIRVSRGVSQSTIRCALRSVESAFLSLFRYERTAKGNRSSCSRVNKSVQLLLLLRWYWNMLLVILTAGRSNAGLYGNTRGPYYSGSSFFTTFCFENHTRVEFKMLCRCWLNSQITHHFLKAVLSNLELEWTSKNSISVKFTCRLFGGLSDNCWLLLQLLLLLWTGTTEFTAKPA